MIKDWDKRVSELKARLVLDKDVLPPQITRVAGLDISFDKHDPTGETACAGLVVLSKGFLV